MLPRMMENVNGGRDVVVRKTTLSRLENVTSAGSIKTGGVVDTQPTLKKNLATRAVSLRHNQQGETMKKAIWFVLGACLCLLSACGYANIDEVKAAAPAKWEELGYSVHGYEGYQWGMWLGGRYGGAQVWHQLRRIPDNGIAYTGHLQMWGDELHVYGPRAIDALKP